MEAAARLGISTLRVDSVEFKFKEQSSATYITATSSQFPLKQELSDEDMLYMSSNPIKAA